jgi:hypothetical protein
MTPQEWNAALSANVPWQQAYATVETATRALLNAWPDDEYGATSDLVEELYPMKLVRGDDGVYARKRIFKALMALAPRGLKDCCKKGAPKRRFGNGGPMIQPWEWFKPGFPSDRIILTPAPETIERKTDVDMNGNCVCCGQPVF